MWDGKIVFGEGILLISAFIVYLLYTIFQKKIGEVEEIPEITEFLPSRVERRKKEIEAIEKTKKKGKEKISFKTFLFLILGVIGLVVGANYTIESVLKISEIFKISASLIAITAVALGTSLPELVFSVRAAWKKKYEIALGNVFGSNIFNVLLVVGIPALIRPLIVDELTFRIGLPFLIVATLLFIVSGISRRIHIWEGLMYLLLYVLFIIKLCGLF